MLTQTGNIVRIAPNRYSVSDPAAVRIIYGIGSPFSKPSFYTPFVGLIPEHPPAFTELSNAKHAAARKRHANLYAMSSLVMYEPFVEKVNGELLDRLDGFAQSGQSFDLFKWMQLYAMDVIGEITIGRSFGMIEAGKDHDGLLWAVDFINMEYGPKIGLLPELHPWYLWIANVFSINDHTKIVRTAIEREIAKRKDAESLPDREDFMTKLLAGLRIGKLEQYDVNNVIGANIGAGSETSGIAFSAVIYYLVQNPECMSKVLNELDSAQLSNTVKFKEGQTLKYLQAVIKEALRLHAMVGMLLAREVGEGGAVVADTFFPQGSVVGINPHVIHQDKSIFGEDADKFNPDRWLGDKEKTSNMEKHFLATFEFSIAPGSTWKTYSGFFIKPSIHVQISRRRHRGEQTTIA
ncbi:hypothetical protein MRB53_038740 [Persea americana]|nr:hypothetical protein MRB53_038740 [Persea americana]